MGSSSLYIFRRQSGLHGQKVRSCQVCALSAEAGRREACVVGSERYRLGDRQLYCGRRNRQLYCGRRSSQLHCDPTRATSRRYPTGAPSFLHKRCPRATEGAEHGGCAARWRLGKESFASYPVRGKSKKRRRRLQGKVLRTTSPANVMVI